MPPFGAQALLESTYLGEFSLELRSVADIELRPVGESPAFLAIAVERESGKANTGGIGAPEEREQPHRLRGRRNSTRGATPFLGDDRG